MKTKSLLFAMFMAPAVFTACSNEDIVEQVAQDAEAIPGKDVTLVFQAAGANSRMDYTGGAEQADGTWTSASYKWQLGEATANCSSANAVDKVGLSRVVSGKGTSNYLFYPTKVISAGQTAWMETKNAKGTGAQFSTDNLTIYTGDYVAYYPYNENMVADGPLTLTLNQAQVQSAADNTDHVAKNGFAVSDIIALEGGQQVNKDFTLSQLYGVVYFRMKGDVDVVSVSLESATAIFPTEATLDVTKLQSKKASELTTSDLTFVDSKKVNHIDVTLTAAADLNATDYKTCYMTLMPGTYNNVSIVYRTATGSYSKTVQSLTVEPGKFVSASATLAASDFTPYGPSDQIIVNDATSWAAAVQAVATVSNTTRVISVNAPIELKDASAKLLHGAVDASKGKVIVKGQPITVSTNAGVGNGTFKNVVFENQVIIGKDVTTITVSNTSNVTFENLDADNALTATALTVTVEDDATGTALNLKNASIKGVINLGKASGTNAATLNVIEGGNVTTEGELEAITSGDATVSVAKGGTWNATKTNVATAIKLDVDGNLNINEGSAFTFNGGCDFTNGTVAINGGNVNVAAVIAAVGTNPGDVAGTITNNSGTVMVDNPATNFTTWAAAGKSASFTNKANYYAMGFATNTTLTAAIADKNYAEATGFELKPTSPETWSITGINESFDCDLLLNAATQNITITIPDNATCTVNGDIIVSDPTNEVTITKVSGTNPSVFKAENVTVYGKLQVGDTKNDANFKLNCKACYVAGGATLTNSSNLTGCTPTVDGTIIK